MVSFIFNWDKTKQFKCPHKYVIAHPVLVLLILDLKVAKGAQRRDKVLILKKKKIVEVLVTVTLLSMLSWIP